MNLHRVDFEDYIDILARSKVLTTLDAAGGGSIHVAEYAGNDVLIITDMLTGGAVVIESDDAAYGGSIHHHARQARGFGLL